MRIMDFILMSLFIRMPGGLGPFGGNKLQTLPMHFKTHQCHIKGKKINQTFPLLSVHCSFHLGEPNAICYSSCYCCKLIPYLCWDISQIHRHFQIAEGFFHPLSKTGNYLWAQDPCVEIPKAALVHTFLPEIYSSIKHCQRYHSLKTRVLPPPNTDRNPVGVQEGSEQDTVDLEEK